MKSIGKIPHVSQKCERTVWMPLFSPRQINCVLTMQFSLNSFLDYVQARHPHEPEFHQAVTEVFASLVPVLEKKPEFIRERIPERIIEPERIISFRVVWEDDEGRVHVNRGYRVQMSSVLGPYKGGLRFHPSVNQGILKFLAFEQVFKNALTGLPMGAGKGGSDFDPKGRSDREVMRFAYAFMNELFRHIGKDTDIPAGDIGVGGREIGYLFGKYKKITNQFTGVLTGKGISWGGSLIRTEATGFGLIYFAQEMLVSRGDSLKGKRCLVSGSGNVALYAIKKILEMGGTPLTASDSSGYIYDPKGIDEDKWAFLVDLKENRRGRVKEYAERYPEAVYTPANPELGYNPLWAHEADCAFPCATQNEVNKKDAEHLVAGGVKLVAEGANMPCTIEAVDVFKENGVMYAPGKAANAGGVAVSGLEMTQNSIRIAWDREEVDIRLQRIMRNIHEECLRVAEKYGKPGDYLFGANAAGFLKVAYSMLDQGLVG